MLMVILLMMGAISAYAYDAAGTTVDRATRVADVTTLSVQSGSNYIRIEPNHLPATIIYTSETLFGPIPAALAMSDTIEAERIFEDCQSGWKWELEVSDQAAIVEIKAHESALIHVSPFVCQPTSSDTTATACSSFEWRGATYDEDGDYSITLVNAAGCDSVRTLHLTIFKPIDTDTVAEAWDSLLWYGDWYDVSADYPMYLKDEHECEYTHTLHLTIHTTSRDTALAQGCLSAIFEEKKYTEEGVYALDTTVLTDGNRTIRYVEIELNNCPKDTTIFFCAGQNTEHEQIAADGSLFRYKQYNYTSPADWNYMEGVILDTEDGKTLVDLARAEENLYAYYVAPMTPVKSIVWSFRSASESIYHVIEAAAEAQWLEAGDVALTVRFLCGQTYYGGFSTRTEDLIDVQGDKVQCTKVLMNGRVVIVRDGVRYTILGTRIE